MEDLGVKFRRISIDRLWRVKFDGQWHLICEYFGSLKEKILNKAKILLNNDEKMYLLWSNDNNRQHIAITDGKIALLINNVNSLKIF
jgi:hypothetical protein